MKEGRIIKAISGFYDVLTFDREVFRCRGRGVFRNQGITPLVGDFVTFTPGNDSEGYVTGVKPRVNAFVRPSIANVDQAIIISSAADPDFKPLLLDRFLVAYEAKQIQPVIFISKMDLLDDAAEIHQYKERYREIGYETETYSTEDGSDLSTLTDYFSGKVSVIAGQSGVGKSSLLNGIDPQLELQTGDISTSLGRGKHTTRHVELMELGGGLVADTPGFSSIDFEHIESTELSDCFPEFRIRKGSCKFRGCMHHKEPGCSIKEAVTTGEIAGFRYDHYLRFLEEIQNRKPRY